MSKQRIGYIGVGLMGHGAAKNMLQNGYPLTIMGHRNRAPVDDLVALGAREAKTAADVARASDVLFLCLPSTVEVEHTIYGVGGVLKGAAKGLIVVDSTTADPRSTQRIGADLAKKGIRMADAPLGRTPKEAEAGKLSTFVGGNIMHGDLTLDQLFSWRPVAGYADYRTPIKNLYLCGSGTHPGGGISGINGRNASREILKDLKRRR